jgi:two-component system, cell cycle sensor histidine kinase and response regulator CckA
MSTSRSSAQMATPFLPPVKRDATAARRLLGLVALMAAIAAIAVMLRGAAAPLVAGAFVLFAALGVAALFAAAAGFLHLGVKSVATPSWAGLYAEHTDRAVVVSALDGSLVFANAVYRQMTGSTDPAQFSVDAALLRQFGGAEQLYRLIRAARRGETAQEEFQSLGPRSGKGERWIRASVRPISGQIPAEGEQARADTGLCLWEITDISAERERDARIARGLRDVREVLDEAPVGLFAARPDGSVPFINARLAGWLDLGKDGESVHKLSNMFLDKGTALLTPPVDGKTHDVVSAESIKRDGTVLPVSVVLARRSGSAESGKRNDPTLFGAVFDPLLLADPEERHTDARQLLKLFRTAPIAIATVSKTGAVTANNMAFAKFMGGAKIFDKLELFDLVDDVIRERLRQALDKASQRKAAIPPVDIATADGKRTGRLFFTPLAHEEGEDVALVFGIDTSEQRLLEEQIAQSQKMQAIGQLAGGIAHDFNNVLTAIIGYSDLLLQQARPGDPSFGDLMNIKNNANRAAGLVRHLLAFSRKQTLRPQVLSLTDALEDVLALLGQLLGEKVRAKVVHGRDLWMVKVDPTQFQQVVINLAVNARDAMPGGGELTIRTANISERESALLGHAEMVPSEYVLCEVSDNGTGIPPEIIDKIFEPFFSTKEVGKGTGLGLSTVYGIVKQTGGYIYAESEVGEGTVFRIYLPRCEEAIEVAEAPAEKGLKKEAARDLTGSATVLLVEDEDAVRSFAVRALTTRGYKVLEAHSGTHALEVLEEHNAEVDLVISDVVMPEMDGPTLLKHLRKANPQIKIIFISGYAEEAFRNNLDEDETFTFLPKPFSLKKLAAAVKETLGEA